MIGSMDVAEFAVLATIGLALNITVLALTIRDRMR